MPNPNLPPFQAPFQKAAWAHKITLNLSDIIEQYKASATAEMKPDPYSEPHPEIDYYRMQFDPPMPEQIPFLLGDAVHNLRASLDILICDVAEMRGQRRTYKFPFAENEEALVKIIEKEFKRLGDDVTETILKLRPYSGEDGNVNLRGLHDLDILDKHRIIIPFFGAASKLNPEFGGDGFMFQFMNMNITFSETQRLQLKKNVQNPTLMKFDKIEDPYFPGIAGPFATKPLVPVLLDLHTMVVDIIDGFSALFGTTIRDKPAEPE